MITTFRETFSASTYTALEPEAIEPIDFVDSSPTGDGLINFDGVFVGVFRAVVDVVADVGAAVVGAAAVPDPVVPGVVPLEGTANIGGGVLWPTSVMAMRSEAEG